ncbi:T-cell surface protein tactile isoform X2 [Phascolarctos cinereus]|uniref:T-cell surface protein tactile n=1 Tax=Phascolarctos cinereus TaxID=38626 RepID=A0A6P5M2U0_PHACI|nr:T-cell surface protein tactile [Phascolarctos cinereus]XP_020862830.1 T-cell surface protein tactile [Phascolarctos cinereus]XP_020862831.1 T-cell surface protein tactile [Phascolarctos cinereus]
MEKKWAYGVIYSFIHIHLVWGLLGGTFEERKVIYASPGTDVNLTCQTQKRGSLVQTQWSKITNSTEMIALYHPQYGYYCAARTACESLVSFTELSPNVSEWALHLRNVSAAMSGKYQCSFTLYPEGTWTMVRNFFVQSEVAQDERGGNYTVEVLFNHTLEIPCFQNISSVVSSEITVAWLMEENGMQETLFIHNNTFLKNRIVLLKNHGLYLSSVEIFDDDRKFSCHVTIQSGKILKNVTRIKVFAKPEISMNMQNSSTDILEEKNFNCLVRNVFPMANLSWYMDGKLLQNKKEGIYITTGKRKRDEGIYEVTSKLRVLKPNQPILPNNLTIWCMTLFPVPGNEVWNISSRKIAFSFGYVNTPTDPSNIMASTFSTFTSPVNSRGTAGYVDTPTDSSNITASTNSIITPSLSSTGRAEYLSTMSPALEETSSTLSNPDPTSHTHQFNSSVTAQSYPDHSKKETEPTHQFNSSVTTQSYPDHSKKETEPNLWVFTLTYNSTPSGADTILNGTASNKTKRGMSWPVIVAGLLFICVFLFGLGIRKWCQYWTEIMERPPPFKPPPPPIKYTCIGESVGGDLPCHEMETL